MPSKIHPRIRVAAVQAAPTFLNLDATIDKTINLMEEAARQGVKLIAFPETWIPGYPWWIWLSAPAMGMQYVQRYHDNSLIVGSAEFGRLSQAARDCGIWLSTGFSEKAGGSLYMGQALFDDQGHVVKRHTGFSMSGTFTRPPRGMCSRRSRKLLRRGHRSTRTNFPRPIPNAEYPWVSVMTRRIGMTLWRSAPSMAAPSCRRVMGIG